jgi:hypothetical protein
MPDDNYRPVDGTLEGMDDKREPAVERDPTADQAAESAAPAAEPEEEAESAGVGIVGHLHNVAGPVAGAIGPVAGAIGSIIGAAGGALMGGEARVERRIGRRTREPLANLYEIYPDARQATPHELGMRFVPVEDIRGTAVAGSAQRGGDFLPLKQLRGENWEGRWRRIREANARLQPLPPVDLIKYEGDYWVVDGHNRVAAALYDNGAGLDAMITELVPLDGSTSERPRNLLSYLGEAAALRAAAQGHRPAVGMRQVEQLSADEAALIPLSGYVDDEADEEGMSGEQADRPTPGPDEGL